MRIGVGLIAAGICLAALKQPFEFRVVPAGPDNQRNSEADMLRLRDGRLMLAWIDFHGPAGSDWANATDFRHVLQGPRAHLGRKVHAAEHRKHERDGPPTASPAVGQGPVSVCRKNRKRTACRWSAFRPTTRPPFRLLSRAPITPAPSYTGFNHDGAIQLKSGRILMPVFDTPITESRSTSSRASICPTTMAYTAVPPTILRSISRRVKRGRRSQAWELKTAAS